MLGWRVKRENWQIPCTWESTWATWSEQEFTFSSSLPPKTIPSANKPLSDEGDMKTKRVHAYMEEWYSFIKISSLYTKNQYAFLKNNVSLPVTRILPDEYSSLALLWRHFPHPQFCGLHIRSAVWMCNTVFQMTRIAAFFGPTKIGGSANLRICKHPTDGNTTQLRRKKDHAMGELSTHHQGLLRLSANVLDM